MNCPKNNMNEEKYVQSAVHTEMYLLVHGKVIYLGI